MRTSLPVGKGRTPLVPVAVLVTLVFVGAALVAAVAGPMALVALPAVLYAASRLIVASSAPFGDDDGST